MKRTINGLSRSRPPNVRETWKNTLYGIALSCNFLWYYISFPFVQFRISGTALSEYIWAVLWRLPGLQRRMPVMYQRHFERIIMYAQCQGNL